MDELERNITQPHAENWMATSKISTHAGVLQPITSPDHIEILQDYSKLYPNGQKLIQIQFHISTVVLKWQTFLWTSSSLMNPKGFVSFLITDTNEGKVYIATMNGDGKIVCKSEELPIGYYAATIMYE